MRFRLEPERGRAREPTRTRPLTPNIGNTPMSKAIDKPTTILNIEALNAIGARLSEHAAAITQDIAADLRLSARVCDRLASLRGRVAEIAQAALDRPQWDAAAFARDIRDALSAAENGGDLPEANRSSHYST
jgi:hypothetical protein